MKCPQCGSHNDASRSACSNCDGPLPPASTLAQTIVVSKEQLDPFLIPLRSSLGHRYEFVSKIGAGSLGDVYFAHDKSFNHRPVAVKILDRVLSRQPEVVTRFHSEVQILARLTHPNIIPVLDSGEGDSFHYFTMPFYQGGNLRAWMQRTGPADPPSALQLISTLASALAHCHQMGIVHRDVKPENILFDSQHNAFLSDFGVAKTLHTTQLTIAGTMVGTGLYMSPEQFTGGDNVDHRADIYALGILLHELLTGSAPFQNSDLLKLAYMHLSEPPVPPHLLDSTIPESVSALTLKALAKKPEDRYQSCSEFVQTIDRAVRGETISEILFLLQAAGPLAASHASPVPPPPPPPGPTFVFADHSKVEGLLNWAREIASQKRRQTFICCLYDGTVERWLESVGRADLAAAAVTIRTTFFHGGEGFRSFLSQVGLPDDELPPVDVDLIAGWKCRCRGCGHVTDSDANSCPVCNKISFHELRLKSCSQCNTKIQVWNEKCSFCQATQPGSTLFSSCISAAALPLAIISVALTVLTLIINNGRISKASGFLVLDFILVPLAIPAARRLLPRRGKEPWPVIAAK